MGKAKIIFSKFQELLNKLIERPCLLFGLFAFLLSFDFFILGPFSYVYTVDCGDWNLPMYISAHRFHSLGNYWNHSVACGVDALSSLADYSNIFQITHLFFSSLPGWFAYGLIMFLQRFLAGYFTYKLCRDCLKLEQLPSIYAGLIYAAYNFFRKDFVLHDLFAEPGLPLVLWSLERISVKEIKEKGKYVLAFLLGTFLSFSSFFVLATPFLLAIIFVWFLLVRKKFNRSFLVLLGIFSFAAVIWKIQVVWALVLNVPFCDRANDLLPFWGESQIKWFINNVIILFLQVPFILILSSLFLSRFKHKELLSCFICLICTHLVGYGVGGVMPFIQQYMGFLKGFGFDRFILYIPFWVSICGAYSLSIIFASRHVISKRVNIMRIMRIAIVIIIVMYFAGNIGYRKYWSTLVFLAESCSYSALYRNPQMEELAANTLGKEKELFRVASIPHRAIIKPAYAQVYGFECVDSKVSLCTRWYRDFWGRVIVSPIAKDKEWTAWFHTPGMARIIYLWEKENLRYKRKINFEDYWNLHLLSLTNTKYIISPVPLMDKDLELVSGPDGPGKLWDEYTRFQKLKIRLKEIFRGRKIYIYNNLRFLPRFYLVKQTRVFSDKEALLDVMSESGSDSFRNAVYLEESIASSLKLDELGFSEGSIVVEDYSPDRIKLSIRVDGNGILVILNSYNPYWECRIDGHSRDIFRVYRTFSGVMVHEGEKEVLLEYRPPYKMW